MPSTRYEKYFFVLAIFAALAVAFFLIKPFFTYLVVGAVLTYLLFPVKKRLVRWVRNDTLCSILMILLVLLLIILPSIFITTKLVTQVREAYVNVTETEKLEHFSAYIERKTGQKIEFRAYFKNILSTVQRFMLQAAPDFLGSLADLVLGLFVMFFGMFYAFHEGPRTVEKIRQLIPLDARLKEKLLEEMRNVVRGVLYGQVVTALVQGTLGGLGFFIFDVPNPVFWGALMVVLAFIPFVGATIVWLPASLIQIAYGQRWQGVGLLIYSAVLVMNVDNVIKPRLISGRSKIHPVVVLLGVLGGLKLFGFIGLILGPLVLALLIALLRFYEDEYLAPSASA